MVYGTQNIHCHIKRVHLFFGSDSIPGSRVLSMSRHGRHLGEVEQPLTLDRLDRRVRHQPCRELSRDIRSKGSFPVLYPVLKDHVQFKSYIYA
jgi:hypothetical protein